MKRYSLENIIISSQKHDFDHNTKLRPLSEQQPEKEQPDFAFFHIEFSTLLSEQGWVPTTFVEREREKGKMLLLAEFIKSMGDVKHGVQTQCLTEKCLRVR